VLDLMKKRAMCRSYSPRPVPRAHLVRILDAARKSPSAGHAQGIRFGVVTDSGTRRRIAAACGESDYVERGFKPWLSDAPVHVVVAVCEGSYQQRYSEPDKTTGPGQWNVPYPVMDAGKSLMSLYLAAQHFGLSTGYLGPHQSADLVELLGLPQEWRFLGLVTIGYRKGGLQPTKSRGRGWRPFDEVVKWIR
jgi:FMN reductase [NAD(P)H]